MFSVSDGSGGFWISRVMGKIVDYMAKNEGKTRKSPMNDLVGAWRESHL